MIKQGRQMMKKLGGLLLGVALVLVGGCDFIMGPDEPAGSGAQGTLTISVGAAGDTGRAISSGAGLPGDVLSAMEYDLTLTGPSGETLTRTGVSTGDTLSLAVTVGAWRIDANAYQETGGVLAGTGSVTVTVEPGPNNVRVPMYINGECYTITVDPAITHGSVVPNFTAAFPGTAIVLRITPEPGYGVSPGTLTYFDGSADVSIPASAAMPADTFVMPSDDTTIKAQFVQGELGGIDFDWQ
jgi:hypothetical protein